MKIRYMRPQRLTLHHTLNILDHGNCMVHAPLKDFHIFLVILLTARPNCMQEADM